LVELSSVMDGESESCLMLHRQAGANTAGRIKFYFFLLLLLCRSMQVT